MHFTWSGFDACNTAAWASNWSKQVLPCGRHMGCKFDDSCVMICGINFKAGYFRHLS